MENDFLRKLLDELADLDKTPKFQLERAISPLLGIFINDIINKVFDAKVIISIPEFPLKKPKNKQSTNIDWLSIDNENKTLYCIELKTDTHSFRDKQLEVYTEIREKIIRDGAEFLFQELKQIAPKSNRKEKYRRLLEKIDIQKLDFSLYKNFEIIYLVPDDSKLKAENVTRIDLSELPFNIDTAFKQEWWQIKDFLINLYASYKKQEGNIVVFKDLGIYSEDPEEDKRINENLIKFLESQGYKMPELIILNDKDAPGS